MNARAVLVERPDGVADPKPLDRERATGRVDQGAAGEADRARRLAGGGVLLDCDRAGGCDRAGRARALRRAGGRLGEVVEAIRVVADRIEGDRVEDLPGPVDLERLVVAEVGRRI